MTDQRERFISLDVFRGMTIFLMIIVNTPGKGAEPFATLEHAKWFGFTLADLVFPSFLFAVGNALSFSIKRYNTGSDSVFLKKVLKRAALIFLIGYLMYWFPFFHQMPDGSWEFDPISHTRIMGVLQRIALCFLFGSLIVRYCSPKTSIIISIILLLGYWATLYLFAEAGQELTRGGNAGMRLDLFLFGENHLYQREGVPFDPEGFLGTLPAIVNVIAGYLAGAYIQKSGKDFECIAKLLMTGVLLIFLTICWEPFFPISKKLWTGTFVLYTIGIDLLILALLVYAIEILGKTALSHPNTKEKWQPGIYFFSVFGKNPLFIYLLSELLYIVLLMIKVTPEQNVFKWVSINIFQFIVPGAIGSLLCAIAFTLICWLAGFWLDKKKIYIRL